MSSPNYQELYNSVKWQNDMMENQQAKMRDLYSTDQQRVKYLLIDQSWYVYINFILWCIYYVLCIGVIFVIFFGKNKTFSISYKIFITLIFLIFPIFYLSVELTIYHFFAYIYSLVMGTAYQNKGQNEMPSFSTINLLPPGSY